MEKEFIFESNLESIFGPIEKANQATIDCITREMNKESSSVDDNISRLIRGVEISYKEGISNFEIISKKLKKIKTSLKDTSNQKEALEGITDMLADLISSFKPESPKKKEPKFFEEMNEKEDSIPPKKKESKPKRKLNSKKSNLAKQLKFKK